MGKKKPKVKIGDLVVEHDDPSRTLLVIEIKGERVKVAPFIMGFSHRRLSIWVPVESLRQVVP